ncbi:MAG: alpha/beta fold hydrolase [Nevskiaceae bacterium]|nr:MAG: alpha/beta fold hydrolase [Nevskiaceae bacterium]TBR71984.1 MAG: alpha/beta fold hydrolase [Nevskiaceae bacterium]
MRLRDVEFPGHDGLRLAGRLNLPDGEPRAWALYAHCFTCGKDVLAAARIAAGLTRAGIAVLRFDFAGIGGSAGDFADTNYTTAVEDLLGAAAFLRREHAAPALLVGHSFGGAVVLGAAAQIPEVKAVATVAAPSAATHVLGMLDRTAIAALRAGTPAVDVELFQRHFTFKPQFVADLEAARVHDAIARLPCALLALHSPQDELVAPDNAQRILATAPQPKSFIALDGADHLLTRREDADYAARVIATWAERYLPPAPPATRDLEHVSVSESGGRPWACDLHVGRHELVADEPETAGGADTGPTPIQYLEAALAACTAMTVRMVANHKGWPLAGINVEIHLRTTRAGDRNDTHLDRDIELLGALDDTQRAYLLQIANRCPVHRILTGQVEVTTRLKSVGFAGESATSKAEM